MRWTVLAVLALWACATLATGATAQPSAVRDSGAEPTVNTPASVLPEPLTEEAIREVLSELDDAQVRALLLERLSAEAERRAEARANAEPSPSLSARLMGGFAALGVFLADVVVKVPRLPGEIAAGFATFADQRGAVGWPRFVMTLGASFAAGALAAFTLGRVLAGWRHQIVRAKPTTLRARVSLLVQRFLTQGLRVATFVVTAQGVNAWLNGTVPADRMTVAALLAATGWTWLALTIARFFFAPTRPELRLGAVNDEEARFLTRRAVLVTAIFMFGFGFTRWLNDFGSVYRDSWHGFWVNTAFHIALALSIWQGRGAIRAMLHGNQAEPDADEPSYVRAWPQIAVGLVAVHWFLIEFLVANLYVPEGLMTSMALTLIVALTLPFLDQALRAVVASYVTTAADEAPVLHAAHEQTRRGLVRVGRVAGAILLITGLLVLWGVDVVTLAEQGVGAGFAAGILDALVIVALAYGAWELIRIVVDRQIAMEQAALGINPDADAMGEGEGGGEGARLGTLLPLVKTALHVAIAVLALLAALGELGINVLPLLAGAGVVGLAIGFGAQSLVKDIVSGIFFLIDDAFRKGEYIDIGEAKGTVERISIRSMQLRHHRGVLNTVPFGDIGTVANYSRDWVVMKFPLRVTYDTDAEKVRKMIKKLGQELLEHPDYGHQFLQPLKCQGVVEMEDSAMIMPVKFMSRPGEQWMLRRVVLSSIHELFERNGIKFAHREVTVRLGDELRERELSEGDRRTIAGSAARVVQDDDRAGATVTASAEGAR